MRKKPFSSQVRFYFISQVSFPDRGFIKEVVGEIGRKHGKGSFTLKYIFCGDQYLLDINRRFLQHDYFTDIITFDLSAEAEEVEGEIYISVDRVKENALGLKVSFYQELARVIFHGALHLCGWNDKTRKDASGMRQEEDRWLRILNTKLFHVKQTRKKGFT
jgi:rRNA maturation RNase YbeY